MTTEAGTKRAVGYRRVSSEGQAGDRHVSLETQTGHIADYCQRAGCSVVANFSDIASGRKDDRREYQRMLEFVRSGHADIIVVQFLDRFGRNPREILGRIWELQEAGVSVEVTDEDVREELVLLVRAGLAGAESKRTSERVRSAMREAAAKGKRGGMPPYGHKLVKDGEDSHYEVDDTEAAAIRRAIEILTTENVGFLKLAERMHGEGYRTRRGGAWTAQAIQRILTNTSLIGTMLYGQRAGDVTVIENFYPPLLTPAEHQALQARLSIRRESPRGRTHSSPFLLSGTARCGYCGGPMVGSTPSAKGVKRPRYACSQHAKNPAICSHNNGHGKDRLERAVLEYLGRFDNPKRVRELLATGSKRASDTEARRLSVVVRELSKLASDLKRDVDLLGRGLLDESDFATVNAGRREHRAALEVERTDLEQAVEAATSTVQNVDAIPRHIRSFMADVIDADPREAKIALQTILKAAYITAEGVELEFRA